MTTLTTTDSDLTCVNDRIASDWRFACCAVRELALRWPAPSAPCVKPNYLLQVMENFRIGCGMGDQHIDAILERLHLLRTLVEAHKDSLWTYFLERGQIEQICDSLQAITDLRINPELCDAETLCRLLSELTELTNDCLVPILRLRQKLVRNEPLTELEDRQLGDLHPAAPFYDFMQG